MGVCTSTNISHLNEAVRICESSKTADAPNLCAERILEQPESGPKGRQLCRLKPLFLEPVTADSTPKSECPKKNTQDFNEVSPSQDSEHSKFYVIRSADVVYRVPLLLDPTSSSINHRRQQRLAATRQPEETHLNNNGLAHPVDHVNTSIAICRDLKLFQHSGKVVRH